MTKLTKATTTIYRALTPKANTKRSPKRRHNTQTKKTTNKLIFELNEIATAVSNATNNTQNCLNVTNHKNQWLHSIFQFSQIFSYVHGVCVQIPETFQAF